MRALCVLVRTPLNAVPATPVQTTTVQCVCECVSADGSDRGAATREAARDPDPRSALIASKRVGFGTADRFKGAKYVTGDPEDSAPLGRPAIHVRAMDTHLMGPEAHVGASGAELQRLHGRAPPPMSTMHNARSHLGPTCGVERYAPQMPSSGRTYPSYACM